VGKSVKTCFNFLEWPVQGVAAPSNKVQTWFFICSTDWHIWHMAPKVMSSLNVKYVAWKSHCNKAIETSYWMIWQTMFFLSWIARAILLTCLAKISFSRRPAHQSSSVRFRQRRDQSPRKRGPRFSTVLDIQVFGGRSTIPVRCKRPRTHGLDRPPACSVCEWPRTHGLDRPPASTRMTGARRCSSHSNTQCLCRLSTSSRTKG
jgi:hypothetical protein